MAKKITINNIAERCNVSKTAVSMVLNNKQTGIGISSSKAELILKTAQEMNYRPLLAAQELASRRQGKLKILLVSPWLSNVNSFFMIEVYRALQHVSDRISFDSKIFVHGKIKECGLPESLRLYDGILIMGTDDADHEYVRELAARDGVKIILLNRRVAGCSCYLTDNIAGGERLAEYVLNNCHYDNYYLWRRENETQVIKERGLGIKRAFKALGRDLRFIDVVGDVFGYEYLKDNCEMFKQSSSFIFFNRGYMVLQALLAFIQNGIKVPEQAGIGGHDNMLGIPSIGVSGIISVDAKIYELTLCVLNDLMEEKLSKSVRYFSPEIMTEESTANPRSMF